VQSNLAAFGIATAALLLASLGLYAIIAFAVEQRTREIGIRIAMGATSYSVVRHFLQRGVVLSAIGLAIGLPVTVAGIRLVEASLIGFSIESIVTVMLVVPVLIAVAMLASWLPAGGPGGGSAHRVAQRIVLEFFLTTEDTEDSAPEVTSITSRDHFGTTSDATNNGASRGRSQNIWARCVNSVPILCVLCVLCG
jgi:hypothetical protein